MDLEYDVGSIEDHVINNIFYFNISNRCFCCLEITKSKGFGANAGKIGLILQTIDIVIVQQNTSVKGVQPLAMFSCKCKVFLRVKTIIGIDLNIFRQEQILAPRI